MAETHPELPDEKKKRFFREFNITEKHAESLVSDPEIAEFFENVIKVVSPRLAASWIAGPLKKTLNWNSTRLSKTGLKENWFIDLMVLFGKGVLTDRNTELVLRKIIEEKTGPRTIIKKYGFGKVQASLDISKLVKSVLSKNKDAVKDFGSGEGKALHFLLGQVMRESKGTVDPKQARAALEKELK